MLNKWTNTIRCMIAATSEATLICIDIQDGKMIETKWKRETYANAYVGEWKKIIERENGNSTYICLMEWMSYEDDDEKRQNGNKNKGSG